MKLFLWTVQFLTAIPVQVDHALRHHLFPRSIIFFPVIGLMAGAVQLFVCRGAHLLFGPSLVTGVLVVLANLWFTGGLHMDGLADLFDALGSRSDRTRMLSIMKDSQLGTYGALAITGSLLLRVALLDQMTNLVWPLALLWGPVSGRMAMAVATILFPYARKEGLGNIYIGKTKKRDVLIPIAVMLLLAVFTIGFSGLNVIWISILAGLLITWGVSIKLDGITGDVLGALNEMVEMIFLVLWLCIGGVSL